MTYFGSTSSTGTRPNHWLLLGPANDLFTVPDSTVAVNRAFVVADRIGSGYQGINLSPAQVSGASTDPLIQIINAGGADTLYYDDLISSNYITRGANYVTVQGVASGSDPGMSGGGVDADVNIALDPKGDGVVNFAYPETGLGGGAAPTLGTVSTGSTGPQTAAQNSWLKIEINGVATWIPTWR